jgi:hypothetical protein
MTSGMLVTQQCCGQLDSIPTEIASKPEFFFAVFSGLPGSIYRPRLRDVAYAISSKTMCSARAKSNRKICRKHRV